jgi:isopentenyl-diphosphate Delta-isomerase
MTTTEQIVFVDQNGKPTGETGPKLESHTAQTKRHLAFSCYIFRKKDNKLLVTQRALGKKVWPGVWTNSVCGHPRPGEAMEDAIKRRALYEVGLEKLQDITCILPEYSYVTPPYNGIIENEFCPVYVAYTLEQQVRLHPDEVEAYLWLTWPEYIKMLEEKADTMSYWAKDQYQSLKTREPFVTLA